MKLINKIGLVLVCAASLFCSCSQEEPFFARENDLLTVDCAEQALNQTLQCEGKWAVDYAGNDWITVTPDSGVGNGSVEYISIAVAYNRGSQREGTIYIDHAGEHYPITITQGACNFAYGTLSGAGQLQQGVEGGYTLRLGYSNAYGDESVKLSCTVTGEAAEGIVTPEVTYNSFEKGNGTIEYAVQGAPVNLGGVTFELKVDGVSMGTVDATVVQDASKLLTGLPVFWDFAHYAAGTTVDEKKAAIQGTQYDYSWGGKSLNPDIYASTTSTDHKILDWNYCDVNQAYFTVSGNITSYAYGEGHAYAKGMVHNDYWLMATKVRNLHAGTMLTFEGAIGCSGSGPKVATLEYSPDGTTWYEAAGGTPYTHPYTGDTANIHFEVFTDNQYVNKDKSQGVRNDKTADDGWAKVTFPIECSVEDGWFYVRLRYSLNLRLNHSESSYKIAATGSERVKNEVKLYVAE